jgi:hypothetical protein
VRICFGECLLDTDARQLHRRAREVRLSPKAFELLKLLVEARPRALSKTELLDRIWPGVFVSGASLARVVNEVRQGIGDPARAPLLSTHRSRLWVRLFWRGVGASRTIRRTIFLLAHRGRAPLSARGRRADDRP